MGYRYFFLLLRCADHESFRTALNASWVVLGRIRTRRLKKNCSVFKIHSTFIKRNVYPCVT